MGFWPKNRAILTWGWEKTDDAWRWNLYQMWNDSRLYGRWSTRHWLPACSAPEATAGSGSCAISCCARTSSWNVRGCSNTIAVINGRKTLHGRNIKFDIGFKNVGACLPSVHRRYCFFLISSACRRARERVIVCQNAYISRAPSMVAVTYKRIVGTLPIRVTRSQNTTCTTGIFGLM